MPSALIVTLSAPLHQLAALVGPGGPSAHPAAALADAHDRLAMVSHALAQAWDRAADGWTGEGASAAAAFAERAVASAVTLADRIAAVRDGVDAAADAVAGARDRLQAIIDEFEAHAAELEPRLDSPGVAEELIGDGRRALDDARHVVDQLRAELGAQAGILTGAPSPAVQTTPAGYPSGSTAPTAAPAAGLGSGIGSGLGHGMGAALGPGLGGGLADAFAPEHVPSATLPDAAQFGTGVTVQLPDGSTALAPNAVAANAVRHALTQLGVPYQWGGTTPGAALDCSGLTQWAYQEAGLNIPRLAQEQDIGTAIDAGSLRPGDLAVWDGHVAMIVGNGTMIEAGDPVQLSPVRTTNAGQGFQGFWRPTA